MQGRVQLSHPICHLVLWHEPSTLSHPIRCLSCAGAATRAQFHPLFDGVGGPAIDQIPQLPFAWYFSLGLAITFCEFYRISIAFRELSKKTGEPTYMIKAETALRPGYEPGQIGFDPLKLAPEDPAEFRLMQEKGAQRFL